MNRIAFVTFALFVSVAARTGLAAAYDFGPPDGFAGDPPDHLTCTTCHAPDVCPPNGGGGVLELVGLPATYDPEQTYHLSLRLAQVGRSVWGFELTVVDDTDPMDFFDDGGTLMVTDPVHTQISEDAAGTKDYLKQTLDGSFRGLPGGEAVWGFDWVAPDATTTSVTFYAAGNAGDGDFSNLGDCIYTLSTTVYPSNPTPSRRSSWGSIKALYR